RRARLSESLVLHGEISLQNRAAANPPPFFRGVRSQNPRGRSLSATFSKYNTAFAFVTIAQIIGALHLGQCLELRASRPSLFLYQRRQRCNIAEICPCLPR